MELQKCGLNLNNTKKELQPHGTFDFPCAGYSEYHTDKNEDIIPWHWHEELEMIYIKSGTLKLQIPAESFELKEGDCIIINSSILHYAYAAPTCELYSLVFRSTLITGTNDSVYANKYLTPLVSCPAFTGHLLESNIDKKMILYFNNAFEALANDTPGFEFIVRENLSKICFFLYGKYEQKIESGETGLNQDNLRIKKMLDHIHDNFADNLALADIAKAADIGKRECLRCFQRTMQISPMQYLLKYRIMQGADLLIKKPSSSVSEIAALSGFDSPSNFTKMFKRFYNCTPREYKNL